MRVYPLKHFKMSCRKLLICQKSLSCNGGPQGPTRRGTGKKQVLTQSVLLLLLLLFLVVTNNSTNIVRERLLQGWKVQLLLLLL